MSPPSVQFGDGVSPGLDRVLDGVVLSGRDPDGLFGEGDVVVVTGRVVAPGLSVVGLAGKVPLGVAGKRGCHRRDTFPQKRRNGFPHPAS